MLWFCVVPPSEDGACPCLRAGVGVFQRVLRDTGRAWTRVWDDAPLRLVVDGRSQPTGSQTDRPGVNAAASGQDAPDGARAWGREVLAVDGITCAQPDTKAYSRKIADANPDNKASCPRDHTCKCCR